MNTADRLLAVLGLFTPERPDWTVEAAAKETGVSVSTAYRYFRSLCKIGLLDPFADGQYVLGPAIIEYDRQIRMLDPLIKIGRPIMQRMITQTGSMGIALLCRVYRNRIMCVHQEANMLAENTVSYERGRPMPMFRGAGKAIVANFPSRTAKWYFEKYKDEAAAAGLGSDWETVNRNLRKIRKAGVLIARGEVDTDRVGVAAAIFGAKGLPIGSISMALPLSEVTHQLIASVLTVVQAAAHQISVALSGHLHEEASPEAVLEHYS
jgi:DNA-binding IclR family transcriptional regulator